MAVQSILHQNKADLVLSRNNLILVVGIVDEPSAFEVWVAKSCFGLVVYLRYN